MVPRRDGSRYGAKNLFHPLVALGLPQGPHELRKRHFFSHGPRRKGTGSQECRTPFVSVVYGAVCALAREYEDTGSGKLLKFRNQGGWKGPLTVPLDKDPAIFFETGVSETGGLHLRHKGDVSHLCLEVRFSAEPIPRGSRFLAPGNSSPLHKTDRRFMYALESINTIAPDF